MDIQVNGQTIHIEVTPLGEPMDTYLKTLFTGFVANIRMPYMEFIKGYYSDLVGHINDYFDSKINNPSGQDFLFNNLTFIWRNYQFQGRVGEAQQFWQDILNIVLDWEKTRNSRIHKGSLFYFWSQTAILQGELDKGFFLIHSAYEEDVLTRQQDLPGTPAYKTVSLNYWDDRNFLFDLVKAWAKYLDDSLMRYRKLTGRTLLMDEFRAKFLSSPPSRDTLFSFTYSIAKFNHFDSLPPIIVQGNFASLFEINSLFDLILVIDATIKAKNPSQRFFSMHSFQLSNQAGLGLSEHQIKDEVNSAFNNNFDQTLQDLLDGKYQFTDMSIPKGLSADLLIAYGLRNFGAHHISSIPTVWRRFPEIRQALFNILFLTVEVLF